jgi:hypothetical protein
LLTCEIENELITIILSCSLCLSLSIGILCYYLHLKNKKRITNILKEIKKSKCTLSK